MNLAGCFCTLIGKNAEIEDMIQKYSVNAVSTVTRKKNQVGPSRRQRVGRGWGVRQSEDVERGVDRKNGTVPAETTF